MNSYEKLSLILNTSPEVLSDLDQKMSIASGKSGVMDIVSKDNDDRVSQVLADLGLNRDVTAEEVYGALTQHLIRIDRQLFELLGQPDLSNFSGDAGKIRDLALQVFTPPNGFFIKKEKVVELLEKQPPQSLLDHFGYANVAELIEKEGFESVVAALRFTQTTEWMHQFFDVAYSGLTPEDFEDREVEVIVLDSKWLEIAQKFIGKKFHNVSHLKELGVIFVIPISLDIPGDTMRLFALLLHYFHEVPFYSKLFREYAGQNDGFADNIISLLRGDVLEGPLPDPGPGKVNIRIVQRYLAKDNPQDPRLFEPHVNPETRHWDWAEADLTRLDHEHPTLHLGFWAGLNWVGGRFLDKNGENEIVGFNLIDVVMSLIKQKEMIKYLYHHQEAFWNQIFIRYIGTQEMDKLIEQNIIKGYFTLG